MIAADERGSDRRERLVALLGPQRLKKHAQQAVATDAEAEDLVGGIAQVVRHRDGTVRRKHRARTLGQIALEAAAAHEAPIVAVSGDQDPVPRLAVGRADGLVHGGEHQRRAGGSPRIEALDDLTDAHDRTRLENSRLNMPARNVGCTIPRARRRLPSPTRRPQQPEVCQP